MEEIQLTRGVYQGCPLSRLLFALTTQLIMDYMAHKLSTRDLEGVKVMRTIIIYHRFFVDDLGMFIPTIEESFRKLQLILKLYEDVARVKMNISKTVIIPLGMDNVPQWIHNTRWKISGHGKYNVT